MTPEQLAAQRPEDDAYATVVRVAVDGIHRARERGEDQGAVVDTIYSTLASTLGIGALSDLGRLASDITKQFLSDLDNFGSS